MAALLPLVLLCALGLGLFRKIDVFEAFLAGAEQGIRLLGRLLPTLCGLLCAVTMLRRSGALEALAALLAPLTARLGVPAECVPVFLLRPVSGGASLALAAETIASAGADSAAGRTAAVLLASSETSLYVLSVYGGAGGLKSARRALPAALIGDAAALLLSAAAVKLFF